MSPDYMFNRGRHSGSFFLKIGAAGFCFGHLIHSCLMLARQILHWTSSDPAVRQKCAHRITLALYLLIPVYSFYQLYILFKYSNVKLLDFFKNHLLVLTSTNVGLGHHKSTERVGSFRPDALTGYQSLLLVLDDPSRDCRQLASPDDTGSSKSHTPHRNERIARPLDAHANELDWRYK